MNICRFFLKTSAGGSILQELTGDHNNYVPTESFGRNSGRGYPYDFSLKFDNIIELKKKGKLLSNLKINPKGYPLSFCSKNGINWIFYCRKSYLIVFFEQKLRG